MGFWSKLENEFNEHFGEAKTEENEENKKLDEEFDDLMGDIKNDLKKIPKGEVIPSYSRHLKDKERYEQEKKRFEEDSKSKRKKCMVGDKTYEVGQRWINPETGQEMICILMNIPDEEQPILTNANIPLTRYKPKPVKITKSKKPSKEPQWSYTNKQKPKRKCEEKNNPGEDDEAEVLTDMSMAEKDEDAIAEDLEDENDEEDNEDNDDDKSVAGEELEEDAAEDNPDDNPKEDDEDEEEEVEEEGKPKEPEIVVVDPESNEEGEGAQTVSGIESDSDSINYESPNTPKRVSQNPEEETEEIEPDEEGEKVDQLPQSEEEEDAMKHVIIRTEQSPEVDSQTLDDPKRHKESEEIVEPDSKEIKEPCDEESPPSGEQKGEPIYTRETVVVQRKLFKTEETIETTETEKYPEK